MGKLTEDVADLLKRVAALEKKVGIDKKVDTHVSGGTTKASK